MKTFTARTPLDLIALAPYLIGFHPSDSVVLMTFGGREPFHARVDLPDHLDDQEAVAGLLREVVAQHDIPRVAVLVYTEDAAAAASQAELLLCGFLTDDVEVIDVLRVGEEEFFPCPDTGAPGTTYDLSAHPFTAARVFDGRFAHESRAALADSLVGTDTDDAEAVQGAATRFAEQSLREAQRTPADEGDGAGGAGWLHEQARWLQGIVPVGRGRRLSATEAGQVLVLCSFEPLRDVAWSDLGRENAREQVELWSDLVRRAPRGLIAAPAALLGFAAWLAGDGALAWCALDRCVEDDPDYSLAGVLARILEEAVPPSLWDEFDGPPELPALGERRAG